MASRPPLARRLVSVAIVPFFLFAAVWKAPEAQAWKPRSHALTANAALFDARDGAVCMPGLDDDQVGLGETPLLGHYPSSFGELRSFNDLKSLGRYVRAGALGPDAWPDAYWGQMAVHVDHSQRPAQPIDEAQVARFEKLRRFFGLNLNRVLLPFQDLYPHYRSIDWGHEVLAQAYAYHREELAGKPRPYIRSDKRLNALLAERQAALAFALGYLMHFAGDAFAHSWINDWTKQPFNLLEGRRASNPNLPPELITVMEELEHIAIEKYVDDAYEGSLVGDGCKPTSPQFLTESESICDDGDVPFALPCDYCNPLREGGVPPSSALSGACDHCFATCNPWREICPMELAAAPICKTTDLVLDTGQMISREAALRLCQQRPSDGRTCQTIAPDGGDDGGAFDDMFLHLPDTREACINVVERAYLKRALTGDCCKGSIGLLTGPDGPLSEAEAEEMCAENTAAERADQLRDLVLSSHQTILQLPLPAEVKQAIVAASPCGCYEGPVKLTPLVDANGNPLPGNVETEVGTFPLGDFAGGAGVSTDYNQDGQVDLINECMMWNCMLSPGTSMCPLNALRAQVPERELGRLSCEEWDETALASNPEPFLEDLTIDMPLDFYRKVFMERRYPAALPPGSVGTYSLGGPVVNGMYVAIDVLKSFEVVLNTLDSPLTSIAQECLVEEDHDEVGACEIALKINYVSQALVLGAALLHAFATGLTMIPWVGWALSLPVWIAYFVVAATVLLLQSGLLPGISLPIAGMRNKLENHLRYRWPEVVMETARGMSGHKCLPTCGQAETTCSDHAFFAIGGYVDFVTEAWDIVDSFQCEENNYITRLASGDMNLTDWKNILKSGGLGLVTQYVSCKISDYFYRRFVAPELKAFIEDSILGEASDMICKTADFYRVQAPGQEPDKTYVKRCEAKIAAFYGDAKEDVPGLGQKLKTLLSLMESGNASPEEKEALYDYLNSVLLHTAGIEVDFAALEAFGNVLDCNVTPGIIKPLGAREAMRRVLVDMLPPDQAAQAEALLAELDRQIGNLGGLNPVPVADVHHFYPLYNTISLNKTILMGNGLGACSSLADQCSPEFRDDPEYAAACDKILGECQQSGPANAIWDGPSGLLGLASLGNARPVPASHVGAYSYDPIDVSADGFLASFFQETWVQDHPLDQHPCAPGNFNVMCNAVYSLDDPDDYCRDLYRWKPGYQPPIDPSEERLVDFYECATKLRMVDQTAAQSGLVPYQPTPRDRNLPGEDPHLDYDNLRPDGDHVNVPTRRAVILDRTVMQWTTVTANLAKAFMGKNASQRLVFARDFLFTQLTSGFWGSVLPSKSGGARDQRLAKWLADTSAPYLLVNGGSSDHYPHDLMRFSLANKDSHVTRLYSNMFAPYYCPHAGPDQVDLDCDAVPDDCDLCPATYNPDQYDSDRNGIGDDCPGFNPATRVTPEAQRSNGCEGPNDPPSTTPPPPAGFQAAWQSAIQGSMIAFKNDYFCDHETVVDSFTSYLWPVTMFKHWCIDGNATTCSPDKYKTCADWSLPVTLKTVPPTTPGVTYVPVTKYAAIDNLCVGDNWPCETPNQAAATTWCNGLKTPTLNEARATLPESQKSKAQVVSATKLKIPAPPAEQEPFSATWFRCDVKLTMPIPQQTARKECGCNGSAEP